MMKKFLSLIAAFTLSTLAASAADVWKMYTIQDRYNPTTPKKYTAATPVVPGNTVTFAVEILNKGSAYNTTKDDGALPNTFGTPWGFVNSGTGFDAAYPTISVSVGGRRDEASIVGVYTSASAGYATALVCEYVVKPGDLARPLKIWNNEFIVTPTIGGTTIGIKNSDGTISTPQWGDGWVAPVKTASQGAKIETSESYNSEERLNKTLAGSNIYVEGVRFATSAPESNSAPGTWLSVRANSTELFGGEAAIEVTGVSTSNGASTLYIWSGNEDVIDIVGDSNVLKLVEIDPNAEVIYNPSDNLADKKTANVYQLVFAQGSCRFKLHAKDGTYDANNRKSAKIYVSTMPGMVLNNATTIINDFIEATVDVIAPSKPSVWVRLDGAYERAVVIGSASQPKMTLSLSGRSFNETVKVDLKVTYNGIEEDATAPEFIVLGTESVKETRNNILSYEFDPGETEKEIHYFLRGVPAGGSFLITPVCTKVDSSDCHEAHMVVTPNPAITKVEAKGFQSGRAGKVTVTITDSERNLTLTDDYKVEWFLNSADDTPAVNGATFADGKFTLTGIEYKLPGNYTSRVAVTTPDGVTVSTDVEVIVKELTVAKLVRADGTALKEAVGEDGAEYKIVLEPNPGHEGDLYAYIVATDDAGEKLIKTTDQALPYAMTDRAGLDVSSGATEPFMINFNDNGTPSVKVVLSTSAYYDGTEDNTYGLSTAKLNVKNVPAVVGKFRVQPHGKTTWSSASAKSVVGKEYAYEATYTGTLKTDEEYKLQASITDVTADLNENVNIIVEWRVLDADGNQTAIFYTKTKPTSGWVSCPEIPELTWEGKHFVEVRALDKDQIAALVVGNEAVEALNDDVNYTAGLFNETFGPGDTPLFEDFGTNVVATRLALTVTNKPGMSVALDRLAYPSEDGTYLGWLEGAEEHEVTITLDQNVTGVKESKFDVEILPVDANKDPAPSASDFEIVGGSAFNKTTVTIAANKKTASFKLVTKDGNAAAKYKIMVSEQKRADDSTQFAESDGDCTFAIYNRTPQLSISGGFFTDDNHTLVSTNEVSVSAGQLCQVNWSLVAGSETNVNNDWDGVKVTWYNGETSKSDTATPDAKTGAGTYEITFKQPTPENVFRTLTVRWEDKDGARGSMTWKVKVIPAKILSLYPLGPSSGVSSESKIHTLFNGAADAGSQLLGARGRGKGTVNIVEAADFGTPTEKDDGSKRWMLGGAETVTLTATPSADKIEVVKADGEIDRLDSYFYSWLVASPLEDSNSYEVKRSGAPLTDMAPDNKSSNKSIRLPSKLSEDGAGYPETIFEAVFSRELYPTDNCGDINADGVPDIFVKHFGLGVFNGSALIDELADLKDLAKANDDADYLPAPSSTGYRTPGTTNAWSQAGTIFGAAEEIRGFHHGLNNFWYDDNMCDAARRIRPESYEGGEEDFSDAERQAREYTLKCTKENYEDGRKGWADMAVASKLYDIVEEALAEYRKDYDEARKQWIDDVNYWVDPDPKGLGNTYETYPGLTEDTMEGGRLYHKMPDRSIVSAEKLQQVRDEAEANYNALNREADWQNAYDAVPEYEEPKWTPERPTDPTLADTDGDGLPDGYEYWMWYYAHVGWRAPYVEDSTTVTNYYRLGLDTTEFHTPGTPDLPKNNFLKQKNGNGDRRGWRFNADDPLTFSPISWQEIETHFDPLIPVSGADRFGNDFDNDGISDYEEFVIGSDPLNCSTANDGIIDGWKLNKGLDLFVNAAKDNSKYYNPDGDAFAVGRADLIAVGIWKKVGQPGLANAKFLAPVIQVYAVKPFAQMKGVTQPTDFSLEAWAGFEIERAGLAKEYGLYDEVGTFTLDGLTSQQAIDDKLYECALNSTTTFGDNACAGVVRWNTEKNPAGKLTFPIKMATAAEVGNDNLPDTTDGVRYPHENEFVEIDGIPLIKVVKIGTLGSRIWHDQVRQLWGFDPRTGWYTGNVNGYLGDRWDPIINPSVRVQAGGMPVNTADYSTNYEYRNWWFLRNVMDQGGSSVSALLENTSNPINMTNSKGESVYGADSDNDGLPDGWELYVGMNPLQKIDIDLGQKGDFDGDGLTIWEEFSGLDSMAAYEGVPEIQRHNAKNTGSKWLNKFFPTDPYGGDTDGDGISDRIEGSSWGGVFVAGRQVFRNQTFSFIYGDPIDNKTTCIRGGGMNPCTIDTDMDGIPDGWEVQFAGLVVNADGSPTFGNTSGAYTDELKISDGFNGTVNALSQFVMGGMDATYAGDTHTGASGTDPKTGTSRDFDFDHDGLENYQEYMTQSVRHWRYDDAETPLNGRMIIWKGDVVPNPDDPQTANIVPIPNIDITSKPGTDNLDRYLVMDPFNDNVYSGLIKSAFAEEILIPENIYFQPIQDDYRCAVAEPSKLDYSKLGYFAHPPKVFDMMNYYFDDLGSPKYNGANPENYKDPNTGRVIINSVYVRYMLPPTSLIGYYNARENNENLKGAAFGPARVKATGYISTDPRAWDSDSDGMDDYYEAFHGLNPLLGGVDLVASAYPAGNMPDGFGANANVWNHFGNIAATADGSGFTPVDAMDIGTFDPVFNPWMTGLPGADVDGDGLRNSEEAITANLTSPNTYHTDPTPAWMTDSSSRYSYVSQYYRFSPDIASAYPWSRDPASDPANHDEHGLGSGDYLFTFEENEGYDTDGDWKADGTELVKSMNQPTDPLNFTDPVRRQAVHFGGDGAMMTKNITTIWDYQSWDMLRQFSVECWVNAESTVDQTILERSSVYFAANDNQDMSHFRANFRIGIAEGKYYALFDNSKCVLSGSEPGVSSEKILGPSVQVGAWYHLAATYDGKCFRLYVNGKLFAEQPSTLIPATGVDHILQDPSVGEKWGFPMASYRMNPSAFVIGASLKAGATNTAGMADTETFEKGSLSEFFTGYVDEVRIWDGARAPEEIASNYNVAFDSDRVKSLHENVYSFWSTGATRNDSDSKSALPAQLLINVGFETLPGADESENVALQPMGFSNAVGKDAPSIGWWEKANFKSDVYTNYQVLPAARNTVAHLAPGDGSMWDSMFWLQTAAGYTTVSKNGVDTHGIPNSMNPYVSRVHSDDAYLHYWRLKRLASVTGKSEYSKLASKYFFDLRTSFYGASDFYPLGDAFAKTCEAMWDNAGPSTVWYDEKADDNIIIPQWWLDQHPGATEFGVMSYKVDDDTTWTISTVEAYIRDLNKGNTVDLNKNGIPDWWEELYGVHDADGDFDNDGLSNLAEYLIEVNEKLHADPRNANSLSDTVNDYFYAKDGETYLGFKYTDHDFMNDSVESTYDQSKISTSKYDPTLDGDNDGWSNWAEVTAGTDPTRRDSTGVQGVAVSEYPIPTVMVIIESDEEIKETDKIVVRAWSSAKGSSSADTIWGIGGEGKAAEHERYLGKNPGSVRTYHLSPGHLKPGKVVGKMFSARVRVEDLELGSSGTGVGKTWITVMSDVQTGSNEGVLVFGTEEDRAEFGIVNYETGDVTLDYTKLSTSYATRGNDTIDDGNTDEMRARYRTHYNVADSFFKFEYESTPSHGGKIATYYLGEADTGFLREGTNDFVAFIDKDGNGAYTPGEPFGFVSNVQVGWDKVSNLKVQLSKKSDAIDRFAVDFADGDSVKVRVVRTAIDDKPVAAREAVLTTTVKNSGLGAITEADLDSFDLDFGAEAIKSATSVTYAVYVGNGTLSNENITGEFIKKFDAERAKATLLAPTAGKDAIVYENRPTFSFVAPAGYTGYVAEIKVGEKTTSVTNRINGSSASVQTFTSPVYFNDADEQTVTWKVQLLNAKFAATVDTDWSDIATFKVAKPVDCTSADKLVVTTKYYGTTVEGQIVVRAYDTADFTGTPVAEKVVEASATAEATMLRVPAGDYYVMAFIDLNKDGVRQAYESWGYYNYVNSGTAALYNTRMVSIGYKVPGAITIYLEDTDLNNNKQADADETDKSIFDVKLPTTDETDESVIDSDGDGIPDVKETEMGLNPYDPSDAKLSTSASDVMAYAEVTAKIAVVGDNKYVLLLNEDGTLRTLLRTKEIPGVQHLVAYGPETAEQFKDVVVDIESGEVISENYRGDTYVYEDTVILIHGAVLQYFGFNGSTARVNALSTHDEEEGGEEGGEEGDVGATPTLPSFGGANTVPFTYYWKYVTRDMLGLTLADGSELIYKALDSQPNGLPDGWELYTGSDDYFAYAYGYNPFSGDADMDGIPNDWEIAHGMNPGSMLDGLFATNDDDVMAYAEVEMTLVTNSESGEIFATFGKPQVGDLFKDGKYYATYRYGASLFSTVNYGIGAEVDPEIYGEARIDQVVEATVALIHNQVKEYFGFDPKTANAAVPEAERVNTKEFTPFDKYITFVYAHACKFLDFDNYDLDPFSVDTDMDGLPDGWELYVGTKANTFDRDEDLDGDGLTNLEEYNKGDKPLDPTSGSTLGELTDDIVAKFGLKTEADRLSDPDMDGLTNYQEYLAYLAGYGDFDITKADSDDDGVLDYFEPVTFNGKDTYVGFAVSDHDMMLDSTEADYDPTYVTTAKYDPKGDLDKDGWSNYAEMTAGTDPTRLITKGIDGYTLTEHPVPHLPLELISEDEIKASDRIFITATQNGKTTAKWEIGKGDDRQAGEADLFARQYQLYVGMNPGVKKTFRLSPGNLDPRRFHIKAIPTLWELTGKKKKDDGSNEYKYSSRDIDSATWAEIGQDVMHNDDPHTGYIRFGNGTTNIGSINYVTGEVTIDFEYIYKASMVWQTDMSRAGREWNPGDGYQISSEYFFDQAYFVLEWDATPEFGGSKSIYRLNDANEGFLREGKADFTVFVDQNGNGEYDEGEPRGTQHGVEIGWDVVRGVKINLAKSTTDLSNAKLELVAPTDAADAVVTTGSPIFRFKSLSGYASYAYTIKKGDVIVEEGTKLINGSAAFEQSFRLTKPLSEAGEYTWSVMIGKTTATASFVLAEVADCTESGSIEVSTKYFGPKSGKTIIRVYDSADFTGTVIGEAIADDANSTVTIDRVPAGDHYIVAFIDDNGNGSRNAYESWGYVNYRGVNSLMTFVPMAVTVEKAKTAAAVLYIEDSDLNNNGIADSLEDPSQFVMYDEVEEPADTDGDGIPDAWENEQGLDSEDAADAASTVPGDVMAYVEVPMNLVTTEKGVYLTDAKLIVGDDANRIAGTTFYGVYNYGSGANSPYGRGAEVAAEGTISKIEPVTVALVHKQVYDKYGFNSKTANPSIPASELVNSKPFTALDKYLASAYAKANGFEVSLRAGEADVDLDGIPDGWELYVGLDPNSFEDRLSDGDGDGLAAIDEYNGGNVTDPNNDHTLDPGISDNFVMLYNLTKASADDDGDGLSNYAEYLITEVFRFKELNPKNADSDGDGVSDYFEKVGNFYLGEVFADHDQIDDQWELAHATLPGADKIFANSSIFDPTRDEDNDGWSNYAEFKAGTDPRGEFTIGLDNYTVAEYPIPLVKLDVLDNVKSTKVGALKIVAWNDEKDPNMTGVPDAIWTIGSGSESSGSGTAGSTGAQTLNESSRYLGQIPMGGIKSFYIGPGSVAPTSIEIQFNDPAAIKNFSETSADDEKVNESETLDATFGWFVAIKDNGLGDLILGGTNGRAVGKVDYSTGYMMIDFGDPTFDIRLVGNEYNPSSTDTTVTPINPRNCHALVSWKATKLSNSVSGTYYLADPDKVVDGNSRGRLREGKNTFMVFVDTEAGSSEGDDTFGDKIGFTVGEPMGIVRGVDVGWAGASLKVELTRTSPIFERIDILNSTSDRIAVLYPNAATAGSSSTSDVSASEGSTDGEGSAPIGTSSSRKIKDSLDKIGEEATVQIYVKSYDTIDGVHTLNPGALETKHHVISETNPYRIIRSIRMNLPVRGFITEADVLNAGEYDVAWNVFKNLKENTGHNITFMNLGLQLVLDSQETLDLGYDIVRYFDQANVRLTPSNLSVTDGVVYGARPTFNWEMPETADTNMPFNTYPAFLIEIAEVNGTTTNKVYDTGIKSLTVFNEGKYSWKADFSVGDQLLYRDEDDNDCGFVLKHNANYVWRVAMLNTKFNIAFNNEDFSKYAPLVTAVNAVQAMNDHNYGSIKVDVAYAGYSKVLAKVAETGSEATELAGQIRVQAFTGADFAGTPVAESIATKNADGTITATLRGLVMGGTYYVRAYIDQDGDHMKSAWESWGAASDDITLSGNLVPEIALFLEDCDVDQDWLPDAWEYENARDSKTGKVPANFLAVETAAVVGDDKVALKKDIYERFAARLAAFSNGLPGASLTTFENATFAANLLGVAKNDLVTGKLPYEIADGSVKIIDFKLSATKVSLTFGAEVLTTVDPTAKHLYDLATDAKVTVKILKKTNLTDATWTTVTTKTGVSIGADGTTVDVNLGTTLNLSSGFFTIELIKE